MVARYRHTNLVARDCRRLVDFYKRVFGCRQAGPERRLSGPALARGTGVREASLVGVHLRLPGLPEDGPTLEIFQYSPGLSKASPAANREGYGHLAFEVDSVAEWARKVVEHGGSMIGEVSSIAVKGAGAVTFVYLADPEGNIIELQSWTEDELQEDV